MKTRTRRINPGASLAAERRPKVNKIKYNPLDRNINPLDVVSKNLKLLRVEKHN